MRPKTLPNSRNTGLADLHLVGKEITRFHCVYWPAFLMAAGLPLPKSITANGWLLFEESKMSKSRGNIVRAETIVEVLGTDALRYFLMAEIPFGQDGSFSFDALVQRYNSDLANGYGNLVSRVLAMIHRHFDGEIPVYQKDGETPLRSPGLTVSVSTGEPGPPIKTEEDRAVAWWYRSTFQVKRLIEQAFSLCANSDAGNFIAFIDGYITYVAPWGLASKDCES